MPGREERIEKNEQEPADHQQYKQKTHGKDRTGLTGRQQKKRKHGPLYYILIVLLILIGAGALCYPLLSTVWNDHRNRQLLSSYSDSVQELASDEVSRMWKEARDYNAQHRVNNPVEPFSVEKEEYIKTHPYDDLLNPNGDGVMGELEIPKISVRLPIFHGTGAEALEKGCGHLTGTSLPTGGIGNHTVLSAHRGLPSAKLFTDLDQVEVGDCFYLQILDQVLAYQVDQILTVLPEESEALAIDPDMDYATLITCTPYGVNTHRLLVRGHRIPYQAPEKGSGKLPDVQFGRIGMTEKIFFAGLAVLFGIVTVMLLIRNAISRKK